MEKPTTPEIKRRGRPATRTDKKQHKYYETFKLKHKDLIHCECGKDISYYSLGKHKKRQYHILTMQILKKNDGNI